MLNYTPNLRGRNIVIISDFVSIDYDAQDQHEEHDFISKITADLKNFGISVAFLEIKTLDELREGLAKYNKDTIVVFNWCEEVNQQENSGYLVTDFLEAENYTFSGAKTHALKLSGNREELYNVLAQANVNVPQRYSFDASPEQINFPVIVKSKYFHGSFGITQKSVLASIEEFVEIKSNLDVAQYYIEQFISGREFTSTILGNDIPEILPLVEYVYDEDIQTKYNIQDHASKWDKNSATFTRIHAEYVENLKDGVIETIHVQTSKAFKAIGDCHLARIEVRIGENNKPYVIDVNPNPNFRPNTSLLMSALKAGYSEGTFVAKLCEYALTLK